MWIEPNMSTEAFVDSMSLGDRFWYKLRAFYERNTLEPCIQYCTSVIPAGESIDSARAFIRENIIAGYGGNDFAYDDNDCILEMKFN